MITVDQWYRGLNITNYFISEIDKIKKEKFNDTKERFCVMLKQTINYEHPKNEILNVKTSFIENKKVEGLISAIKKYLDNQKEERTPIQIVESETMYEKFQKGKN